MMKFCPGCDGEERERGQVWDHAQLQPLLLPGVPQEVEEGQTVRAQNSQVIWKDFKVTQITAEIKL